VSLLIDSHEDLKAIVQNRMKAEYQIDVVQEREIEFSKNVVPLNVKDKDGNTPLHLASKFGHLPIVEFLLQSGADWKLRNKNSQSVEDVAGAALKSLKEEDSRRSRSFKAIARLLQATACASLDLAKLPPDGSTSVDKLFEAIKCA
jgi:hypothetical protein